MKRFIFAAVLSLITALAAYSQDNYDVIYLNNGSVIQGSITNLKENQSVTIRTLSGEQYTYKMIEVRKIDRNSNGVKIPYERGKQEHKNYSTYSSGFFFAIEGNGGYSLNLSGNNIGFGEVDFVGGYRVNEFFRIGAGFGPRYYFGPERARLNVARWGMPLYLNIRGNFIPSEYRDCVPYYSIDCGTSFPDGIMFRPTIGVRIGEPRSAFLLGVSYTGQQLKNADLDKDGKLKHKFTSFLSIKIGYEF